ncbi:hypothetical protein [Butyrivibrio sp. VCD2006]|uniref:hypothetical protein n=1 Tax=Butyrivibrio sp. VCD2006 TaxID=1280664 RepID=UPI000407BF8A|nr:hypothetical protein [Butyrivibrio sp. VCD2006]
MRLKINCDTCDARKINEDNYKGYEEIIVNADEMIVDERSKNILHRLPFSIKADEVRTVELGDTVKNVQSINGVYEIGPETMVQEGTVLSINGFLKIAPNSDEVLKRFEKININGVILCPKSLAGRLPMDKISMNGMTKAYPDDYVLLDNRYNLDRYFPFRAVENKGYFAASCIYDVDLETDFGKLMEKNVKLYTDKFYVRKEHLEKALPIVNIEAKIVEIPDECALIVKDLCELNESLITNYGDKLYVTGVTVIKKENLSALEKVKTLVVDGMVRIDRECVDKFNEINAACDQLVVMEGHTITDQTFATIDRETLENHPEGVSVRDVAMLNISADVPPALIRERLKITDCAKISCSEQQKAALSEVSTDVALIGSSTLKNVFGSLFGKIGDSDNGSYGDTKFVNADYYEL